MMFRQELARRLQKRPALRNPDITVRIGLPEETLEFECKPIVVYVEYLKLARSVPIRAVPCGECMGRGCGTCRGTGMDGEDLSVEALLTRSFLQAFKGRKVKISWSGMEDESSLLTGMGRPTYVEVVAPERRVSGLMSLNLTPAKEVQMTRAELSPLDRDRLEDLAKESVILASFEKELASADVELLEEAYMDRRLSVGGERRESTKKVYRVEVSPSGRSARIRILLDNGVSIRRLLAPKDVPEGESGTIQPSFADLLPGNRILTFENDVIGFRRASQ
jgi:tRNA U54 and U55 pseudouridine synthase Pus10